MIDSYISYLSRSVQAQTSLKQYQNKIAYFLQVNISMGNRNFAVRTFAVG
jgi:hypothetical protein